MTLTIKLPPLMELGLEQTAKFRGMEAADYVLRLIEENVAKERGGALSALMRQWIAEDATDDPEELERREAEWEELKANLNANRAASGERLLFP